MNRLSCLLLTAALFIMLFPAGVNAEEGMWTFDNLPRAALKEHYGFLPSGEWIDHARLSSVKFRNGSGSFITSTIM